MLCTVELNCDRFAVDHNTNFISFQMSYSEGMRCKQYVLYWFCMYVSMLWNKWLIILYFIYIFDMSCIFLVFVAVSACVAIQLGNNPTMMFFQCFCAVTLFYCAHWQTYVSGKDKHIFHISQLVYSRLLSVVHLWDSYAQIWSALIKLSVLINCF